MDNPSTAGHARVHGTPGERPKLAGLMRATWPLLAATGAFGYLLRAALPAPPLTRSAAGFLLLLLAVALAAVVGAARIRLSDFLKGARGEEQVARELMFLPAGFVIFNGLSPAGRSGDFDHVVVGPPGVFLVETKNWAGKITVEHGRVLYNGEEPDRPPLEQVKSAARALTSIIREAAGRELHVTPILCFAADSLAEDNAGVEGVVICNLRGLARSIRQSYETPLTADTVSRIESALKKTC